MSSSFGVSGEFPNSWFRSMVMAAAAVALAGTLAGCVVTTAEYVEAPRYARPHPYYYGPPPAYRAYPQRYAWGPPVLYCRPGFYGPDRCWYR